MTSATSVVLNKVLRKLKNKTMWKYIKATFFVLLDIVVAIATAFAALQGIGWILNVYGFFSFVLAAPAMTLSVLAVLLSKQALQVAVNDVFAPRWYNIIVDIPLIAILATTGHFILALVTVYLLTATMIFKTTVVNERHRNKMRAKYYTGPKVGHIDI